MKLHHLKSISHYKVLESIAKVWVQDGSEFLKRNKSASSFQTRMRQASSSQSLQSLASSQVTTCSIATRKETKEKKAIKNKQFNEKSLDPFKGSLKNRLDHANVQHWPCPVTKSDTSCQMHYWATGKRCRKQLIYCELCEITLCIKCFQPFHTEQKLASKKEQYKKELGKG